MYSTYANVNVTYVFWGIGVGFSRQGFSVVLDILELTEIPLFITHTLLSDWT